MAGLAATNITNVNISDTFYGLLHAGGQSIPPTGQSQIFDGYGTPTALKLGANCNGATICGPLSATSLSLQTPISSNLLPIVTPSVTGTYSGYITGLSITNNGIVTSVSAIPTLPALSPFKAYANINLNIPYDRTSNQGTSFTIVGSNISSVLWIKRGLYRVTFTTPMSNTNYIVLLQNATSPLSGQYPTTAAKSGENALILGYKNNNFFEFVCWTDDGDTAENIQSFGVVVV